MKKDASPQLKTALPKPDVSELINSRNATALLKDEFAERKRFASAPLKCAACGSTDHFDVLEYPDRREWFFQNLTIMGCRKCGFSTAVTKPYGLNEYYQYAYTDAKGRISEMSADTLFTDPDALKSIGLSRTNRHVSALTKLASSFDVALDFGCGYGLTLDRIPARTKIGIELDEKVVPYAQSRGIDVRSDLSSVEDNTVDVMVCSHVLEHFCADDLPAQLAAFQRVLKPGGYLLIEVPNAPLQRLNLTKVKHAPHLSFFTREALGYILEKCGWTVTRLFGVGQDRQLSRKPRYVPSKDEDDVRGGALVAIVQKPA